MPTVPKDTTNSNLCKSKMKISPVCIGQGEKVFI